LNEDPCQLPWVSFLPKIVPEVCLKSLIAQGNMIFREIELIQMNDVF
jgi:hypothetical protein